MAEIPVEKKSSSTWLWIVLALLLAALLVWWATADEDETDYAAADNDAVELSETGDEADAARMDGAAQNNDAGSTMTLAAILAQPQSYVGQAFTGEVTVAEPLTARGFWIESEGSRIFAVVNDQPREVPLDINPGQRLRIDGGELRSGGTVGELAGAPIDNDTRQIIADQDVFLYVDEDSINILERS